MGAAVLDGGGVDDASSEVGAVEVYERVLGGVEAVAGFEGLLDLVLGEGVGWVLARLLVHVCNTFVIYVHVCSCPAYSPSLTISILFLG